MMGRPAQKCMTSEIHYKGRSTAAQTSEQHGSDEGRCAHLLLHVVQRVGRVDRETDEDNLDMDVSIVFTADDGEE